MNKALDDVDDHVDVLGRWLVPAMSGCVTRIDRRFDDPAISAADQVLVRQSRRGPWLKFALVARALRLNHRIDEGARAHHGQSAAVGVQRGIDLVEQTHVVDGSVVPD